MASLWVLRCSFPVSHLICRTNDSCYHFLWSMFFPNRLEFVCRVACVFDRIWIRRPKYPANRSIDRYLKFRYFFFFRFFKFILLLTTNAFNVTTTIVAFLNPIVSYKIPPSDGPMNAPSAKVDVHKPDMRPYVSKLFENPWDLKRKKRKIRGKCFCLMKKKYHFRIRGVY